MFAVLSLYAQKEGKRERAQDDVYATGEANNTKNSINPPKKTNKINIINSKTIEENYIYVGRILVQNGYGLKTSNKDFGLFETSPKPLNRKKAWTGIFNIVVADSLISVSGQVNSGVSLSFGAATSEASYSEINFMGKGLYDNSAFYEMNDLALKFGDNIKYLNQK